MKNVLIDWGPRISILILHFLNFCPQLFLSASVWQTKVFSWSRLFHISPGCFQIHKYNIVRVFETAWSHLYYVLKTVPNGFNSQNIFQKRQLVSIDIVPNDRQLIWLRCMLNLKWIAMVHHKCPSQGRLWIKVPTFSEIWREVDQWLIVTFDVIRAMNVAVSFCFNSDQSIVQSAVIIVRF